MRRGRFFERTKSRKVARVEQSFERAFLVLSLGSFDLALDQ